MLRNYRTRIWDGGGRLLPPSQIRKSAKKIAKQLSSEIDVRILISTLDALRKNGARTKSFEAIPGFLNSGYVNNVQDHVLLEKFRVQFRLVLNEVLDSDLSSNLVSESVKSSQLIIHLNAVHEVLGPDGVYHILYDVLWGRWQALSQSVEMANSLRRWGDTSGDEQFTPLIQRIVAQVVAATRDRDDHWISLIKAEFDIPDRFLRDNTGHGDNVLLSLLIHLARRAFRAGFSSPFILTSFTQFDVCNTLPELQRDFCSLWNEVTLEAWRVGDNSTSVNILRELRHVYIGLHKGTEAAPTAFSAHTYHYNPVLENPQSYRLCNVHSEQTLIISVG